MSLIRNIGRINIYSETLTVILGVYMFVLKGYQKKYLENNKEDNSRWVFNWNCSGVLYNQDLLLESSLFQSISLSFYHQIMEIYFGVVVPL